MNRRWLRSSLEIGFVLSHLYLECNDLVGKLRDLSNGVTEHLISGAKESAIRLSFFFESCQFASGESLIVFNLKEALRNGKVIIHIAVALSATLISGSL